MPTVWTIPADISHLLLHDGRVHDFLASDLGGTDASDRRIRQAQFVAVLDALERHKGETFTSKESASAVLFADGSGFPSELVELALVLIRKEDDWRSGSPEPLPLRVTEKLGTYVYALLDPRDRSILYVGQGRGNRVYRHVWTALDDARKLTATEAAQSESSEVEGAKTRRIREIYKAGEAVQHYILRHDIEPAPDAEHVARAIEQGIVDALRLTEKDPDNPALTNLAGGRADHGVALIEELVVTYAAEPSPELPAPCVIMKVDAASRPGATKQEIYELARRPWAAGPRVRAIDGVPVFVVADNVIRATFTASSWDFLSLRADGSNTALYQFTGSVDSDRGAKYVGTKITPDRVGLKQWPIDGWVPHLTQARPHGVGPKR